MCGGGRDGRGGRGTDGGKRGGDDVGSPLRRVHPAPLDRARTARRRILASHAGGWYRSKGAGAVGKR